jgi:hypothetical protein
VINVYVIDKWQIEYSNDVCGNFYRAICPTVNKHIKYLDPLRKKEVQITRLRLGVANTNQRLFVMKKHLSGLCNECQLKDTINHLLLVCNKEDISERLRYICGIYKDDVSIKNLLSVNIYQNEVYKLVSLITKGAIL